MKDSPEKFGSFQKGKNASDEGSGPESDDDKADEIPRKLFVSEIIAFEKI